MLMVHAAFEGCAPAKSTFCELALHCVNYDLQT